MTANCGVSALGSSKGRLGYIIGSVVTIGIFVIVLSGGIAMYFNHSNLIQLEIHSRKAIDDSDDSSSEGKFSPSLLNSSPSQFVTERDPQINFNPRSPR